MIQTSRDVLHLHPIFREYWSACESEWVKAGLKTGIVYTFRSPAVQDELWRKGRDEFGRIVKKSEVVTYARGGRSFHNVVRRGLPASLALDFAFLDARGRLHYPKDSDPRWEECGRIAESLGITWGVRWGKLDFDLGHLQLDDQGFLSIVDIVDGGKDPARFEDPRF